jgi:rhodanese-related sulfurtransferase
MTMKPLDAQTYEAEEARQRIGKQEASALDIQEGKLWDAEHVPGAIRIPEEELEERIHELPEDQEIIVVCPDGERSTVVAAWLRDRGYEAATIDGGMKGWTKQNFPTQPSPDLDPDADDPEPDSDR